MKSIGGRAIPQLDSVTSTWPVLLCGLAAAIVSAAGPVSFQLYEPRRDPAEVLKSAGPRTNASQGERRLLRAVAIVQTALTLALLVGAGS
jgi:putative ABC transport system permease protein